MIERLAKPLHAPVRRALRQAWELDDADKAERLLRNLARRLDQEAPAVAASILEGLDEMLTVNRLRTGRRAYRARAGSWIPKLEDSVYLRRRNRGALGALGRLEEANGLRSEWRQNYQRDNKISGRGSSTRSKEAK